MHSLFIYLKKTIMLGHQDKIDLDTDLHVK